MVYDDYQVVFAKNNLPVVDLVLHIPTGKRKLGLIEGKITVPNDTLKENKEINGVALMTRIQPYLINTILRNYPTPI